MDIIENDGEFDCGFSGAFFQVFAYVLLISGITLFFQ